MKGIKKVSSFIKQYFVFNRSERKGIYALLVLFVVALAAPRAWLLAFPPKPLTVSLTDIEEAKDNFADADPSIESISDVNATELFLFNPNEADSATFVALGFAPRTAKSIVSYRSKGGRFRKAQDLYRIYHSDSNFISTLIPYARIDADERASKQSGSNYPEPGKKAITRLEINTADSVSLVNLYGIGPRMAAKIIDYRMRSGGFFTLHQLTEIYGIDEDLLDELNGKIYVDVSKVRFININTITFEELKKHPYLRSKTANAIINFRKQHGDFKDVEDLKKIVILPDSTYNKLLPYVRLQD